MPKSDARDALLAGLRGRPVGAEIGVWKGDFSAQILETAKPDRLHLIDPWSFAVDPTYDASWYGGGGEAHSQDDMDRIFEDVVGRFAGDERVVVHRGQSAELASRFEDESLDWVYIDGDHTYEAVRADLELYGPKVARGGIICGDDYGTPGWWEDGVTRAVDELVDGGDYEVVSLEGGQFILSRRR